MEIGTDMHLMAITVEVEVLLRVGNLMKTDVHPFFIKNRNYHHVDLKCVTSE